MWVSGDIFYFQINIKYMNPISLFDIFLFNFFMIYFLLFILVIFILHDHLGFYLLNKFNFGQDKLVSNLNNYFYFNCYLF